MIKKRKIEGEKRERRKRSVGGVDISVVVLDRRDFIVRVFTNFTYGNGTYSIGGKRW